MQQNPDCYERTHGPSWRSKGNSCTYGSADHSLSRVLARARAVGKGATLRQQTMRRADNPGVHHGLR